MRARPFVHSKQRFIARSVIMLINFTIRTSMNKRLGFTLIELLITIAVIAVVIALGIPGLNQYAERNRSASQTNLIVGTIANARAEAIKRGIDVTICASSTPTAATPSCDTAQWELGWIVFADKDQNGNYDTGANKDVLLGVSDKLGSGLTLRSVGFTDLTKIRVQSNGAIRGTAGTFKICTQDADAKKAKGINVSTLGLTSTAQDTDSNNIVNDINGNDVTCP
ncbi:MAG: prepilin-type N-terminal cleavage/methylation domain-containing protein [Gammaproteobacteria bacterium]|nr:prepilin-type N-terminal cleavage/methylation domain-containing protein [Gammaproteobacteria bacterium]